MTEEKESILIFRKEMADLILTGRKTQTRRMWKRDWAKTGRVKFYTKPPQFGGTPFATGRIIRIWKQPLDEISESEAVAEGFVSKSKFHEYFDTLLGPEKRPKMVVSIEFEVDT